LKNSLHIGLNCVDPLKYGGWPGWLSGCVNDAALMASMAARSGFVAESLINEEATIGAVSSRIRALAIDAKAGDSILITCSSHGGRGQSWGDDYRETICLYDGQLADVTLLANLWEFRPGVKLYIILDCCHSGGMNRAPGAIRAMPEFVRSASRPIVSNRANPSSIQAYGIMFCACRDSESALDGEVNGAFTGSLHSTWNRLIAHDRPTWLKWENATSLHMAQYFPSQHPTIHLLGDNSSHLLNEPALN
jgi:hypothetical protein